MSRVKPTADYSIAAVSKLTGVSCHTLRVWERRYGFPTPVRTPTGQRRFRADEVESLRQVAAISREGHTIREVIAELRAGRLPHEVDEIAKKTEHGSEIASADSRLIEICKKGDVEALLPLLDEWQSRLDSASFVSQLIEPTLIGVGELWFRHEIGVYQERYVTSLLFRRIDSLIEKAKQANRQPRGKALVCALQGDRHEGGVRILTLALELGGWRAESLGVDLPVVELAEAVKNWKPNAVGVSFVLSRNVNKRFGELATIPGVPIFVGGRSITNYQGLARRNGLVPLIGPVFGQVGRWDEECQKWAKRQARAERAVD